MPTFENFAHRLARQIEADETFSRYGAVASTPEAEDDHLDVAHVSFANGTIIELRDKVGRGVHIVTYDNEGDVLEDTTSSPRGTMSRPEPGTPGLSRPSTRRPSTRGAPPTNCSGTLKPPPLRVSC